MANHFQSEIYCSHALLSMIVFYDVAAAVFAKSLIETRPNSYETMCKRCVSTRGRVQLARELSVGVAVVMTFSAAP